MRDRIEAVGRILLAAAHADQHVEAPEVDRIQEILEQLWGKGEPLPESLLTTMNEFDPHTFDLGAAVLPFEHESLEGKRRLLDLASSVHAADGELDYAEDTFLRRLGNALGLELAQFQDLLLTILPATPEPAAEAAAPAAVAPTPVEVAKPAAKAAKAPKAKAKATKAPKAKAKATKAPKAKAKAKPKAKAKAKAKAKKAPAKKAPAKKAKKKKR